MAETEQIVEEKQETWDLTDTEPIEPKNPVKYQFKRKREREYYKSINWAEWWDEFNGARKADGKRIYESVHGFIHSKTNVNWQQVLLTEIIGPKPRGTEVRRVPWLGDWQKIRRNGFYVFDDPEKARAVQIALEQKKEQIEASKALAPLIGKRLAYWYRIKDMITEGLVGKLMDDDEFEVVTEKGKKPRKVLKQSREDRLNKFLEFQFKVENMIARLEDQWMRVHGVDPSDPGQQWVNAAELAGKVGAAAALTGVVAAGGLPGRPMLLQDGMEMPLPEGVTYQSLLLAQHLNGHAEMFNMPLPESQQPKNGKAKVREQ